MRADGSKWLCLIQVSVIMHDISSIEDALNVNLCDTQSRSNSAIASAVYASSGVLWAEILMYKFRENLKKTPSVSMSNNSASHRNLLELNRNHHTANGFLIYS